MNIKRTFAATAVAATLVTGFGATTANALDVGDYTPGDILSECTGAGDVVGAEVSCSYKIDKVTNPTS